MPKESHFFGLYKSAHCYFAMFQNFKCEKMNLWTHNILKDEDLTEWDRLWMIIAWSRMLACEHTDVNMWTLNLVVGIYLQSFQSVYYTCTYTISTLQYENSLYIGTYNVDTSIAIEGVYSIDP